jgi:hypothetical protein
MAEEYRSDVEGAVSAGVYLATVRFKRTMRTA